MKNEVNLTETDGRIFRWDTLIHDHNEVIREVVPLVQSEAARYGVTVGLDSTCGLPEVFGDRVQLERPRLR